MMRMRIGGGDHIIVVVVIMVVVEIVRWKTSFKIMIIITIIMWKMNYSKYHFYLCLNPVPLGTEP